jgi:CRP/FNR family transcriptional regulator
MEFLETLQPEIKSLLLKDSSQVKYFKGEIICKQGAYSPQIIFLQRGIAKLYLEHQGRNLILRLLSAGDFVGMPLVDASKSFFPYSVAALEDCLVLAINAENFNHILSMDNEFAKKIIDIQNQFTKVYFERFISLTQKQLHGRIADVVLHLSNDVHRSTTFQLLLTRKDLGEFAGMSTESAIRILREFHNDRIIDIEGKGIEILSADVLKKLSNLG